MSSLEARRAGVAYRGLGVWVSGFVLGLGFSFLRGRRMFFRKLLFHEVHANHSPNLPTRQCLRGPVPAGVSVPSCICGSLGGETQKCMIA